MIRVERNEFTNIDIKPAIMEKNEEINSLNYRLMHEDPEFISFSESSFQLKYSIHSINLNALINDPSSSTDSGLASYFLA